VESFLVVPLPVTPENPYLKGDPMGFAEEYAKKRYQDRHPGQGTPTNGQLLIDALSHLFNAIAEFRRKRR
jgi:hypothetical protein